MFHVEQSSSRLAQGRLPEDDQAAAESLDERLVALECEHRNAWKRFFTRASKEYESTARLQERLRGDQRRELNADGADGNDIAALVHRSVRQQLLESSTLHTDVREFQLANGLAEERALANLRLHHHQRRLRNLNLQRDCRRTATGPDIEDARRALKYAGRRRRLQDEAINGLVPVIERGKVHAGVPRAEESEILGVRRYLIERRIEMGALGAARDALPPIFGVPGQAGSIRRRRSGTAHWTATPPRPCSSRRSSRTMTAAAAGVTPETRDAWPTVSGRISESRWTISLDSPGTPA